MSNKLNYPKKINNLNNIESEDFSIIRFSGDAINIPVPNSGICLTFRNGPSMYTIQFAFCLVHQNVYIRYCDGNENWTTWRTI